jgi:ankyrin repeat protein
MTRMPTTPDPLLERIAAGRTDLVFDYVGGGGAAGAQDGDGASLLYWCARYGDVSAMRFLLAHGERLESVDEAVGLEGAAFFGHWRLCEFLLERGADPNRANPDTAETPLHAALCKPNRPAYELVVRVLLAAGADPNRRTTAGAETGGFMRDCRTRGETPLHRAAAFASESTVRLLLDAGADPRARDAHGDSPLSWASWHTRPDAILRLLCHDEFHVRADRGSTFDHGTGWGAMELDLLGRPLGRA